MSKSEVERFAKDLKTKPALLSEIVALAARHGYSLSVDDAKALSDGQLDALAGAGKNQVLAEAALDEVRGGRGHSRVEILTDKALENVSGGHGGPTPVGGPGTTLPGAQGTTSKPAEG
ncbi:hypothetical protein BH11PSE3_BH11PSE3_07900 [soil metagenome]